MKPYKRTPRGIPKSLLDDITDDPDRWVAPVKGNRRVVDFATFNDELRKRYTNNNAYPYMFQDVDREVLRALFRSRIVRNMIEQNVGKEQADKVYAEEGQIILPAIIPPAPRLPPRISVPTHQRRGRVVRAYSRTKPDRFTNAQTTFLKVRKQKGMKVPDIIAQYRRAFQQDLRSDVSIRTKVYRVK